MLSEPQKSSLVANIILPILAIVTVILRLVQNRNKSGYGISEYLIVLALIFAVADCAIGIWGVCAGLIGVSLRGLPLKKFQDYLLIIFIDTLLCHIIYGLIKVSILYFYKRIFPTPKFRLHANIVLAVVILFTIAITIVQIFGSNPIERAWKLSGYGRGNFNHNHPIFSSAQLPSTWHWIFGRCFCHFPLSRVSTLTRNGKSGHPSSFC